MVLVACLTQPLVKHLSYARYWRFEQVPAQKLLSGDFGLRHPWKAGAKRVDREQLLRPVNRGDLEVRGSGVQHQVLGDGGAEVVGGRP